jgi:hypothetical protein
MAHWRDIGCCAHAEMDETIGSIMESHGRTNRSPKQAWTACGDWVEE